jgi:hypothetical protein
METFITVENKVKILNNLIEVIKNNDYTMVLEFKDKNFQDIIKENIVETELPNLAKNNYDKEYILKVFKVKSNNYYFIANLFAYVSALTVFDKNEMVFLIADDFHVSCPR